MKKFLVMLMSVIMILSCIVFVPTSAASTEGITFSVENLYTTKNAWETFPLTYEAEVKFPEGTSADERGGVIVGNYSKSGKFCTNFAIYDAGAPRIYIIDNGGTVRDFTFNEVSVYTGDWVHVAVTLDIPAKTATCYINGVVAQTLAIDFDELPIDYEGRKMCVGGDLRSGNKQSFKGSMRGVTLYSDVRAADEIKSDAAGEIGTDGLIAAYRPDPENPYVIWDGVDGNLNVYLPRPASTEGITFSAENLYTTKNAWEKFPLTYEAEVKFPEGTSADERGGVIVGNYSKSGKFCTNFAIYDAGAPRIYIIDNGGTVRDFTFNEVSVYTGDWVHVAVTLDIPAKTATCYINGVVAQTLAIDFDELPIDYEGRKMCVGGDLRNGNTQSFKGSMRGVTLYSDVRVADEIKSDAAGEIGTDGLIAAYRPDPENPYVIGDGVDGKLNVYLPRAVEDGLSFDASTLYKSTKKINTTPLTFEAEIYFPKNFDKTTRGGVIVGNYSNPKSNSFSFEIMEDGMPRIYLLNQHDHAYEIPLTTMSVYDYCGEWVHIAVTLDQPNRKLCAYINGELVQDRRLIIDEAVVPQDGIVLIGGDLRNGNKQYFKGSIKSVTLYSDIRTADEVKADAAGKLDTENCMLSYNISNVNTEELTTIADASGNGYDLTRHSVWLKEKAPVGDYAYSFALVGDIQTITRNYPDKLANIYDWIVANVKDKKIEYVFNLGDITDTDVDEEWNVAKENIKKLDPVVPYSVIRGNHDSIENYNKYFSAEEFKALADGTNDNTLLNYYKKFNVGDIKYLLINLDFGPSDDVLAWAAKLIEENPDHNVIITTHAYLYRDGSTLDASETSPPTLRGGHNNGDHIWDKLVRKYSNIVLVICGHDPTDFITVTQTEGDNGNIVTQMLVDPQTTDKNNGPTGLVAMLYFSEDGRNVEVEYYSTVRDEYFHAENQFTMTLDVVGDNDVPTDPDESDDESDGESSNDPGESTDAPTTPDANEPNDGLDGTVTVILAVVGGLAVVALIVGVIVGVKKKKK